MTLGFFPPLDARLEAAADLIRAPLHADIGSDHAALPLVLLRGGRAGRVVKGKLAGSRQTAVEWHRRASGVRRG